MRRTAFFFFFNDTATTEIYPLSLHDALPIFARQFVERKTLSDDIVRRGQTGFTEQPFSEDRKSTRLNSSHQIISYAVFCLKKKKHKQESSNYTHTPHRSELRS